MRASAVASLGCLWLACGLACGDDAELTPVDAGDTADADTRPRPGLLPRPDNQDPSGDPIPLCDRFDPLACGAGQECRVVIRRAAGAADFEIFSGCVEGIEGRALGDPCDPWGGGVLPYQAPGLQAEVYVDPCDEGLFCGPDPDVRFASSCQVACARDQGIGCGSSSQYCLAAGQTSFEDVCRESDGCDPADATACGVGAGCYLRLNDRADGVLSVCLPVAMEVVEDGQPCDFLNSCHPGSSCLPPVRLAVEQWQDSDWLCRAHCTPDPDATALDGGGDEDAGTTPGGPGSAACPGGAECADLQAAGFDTGAVGRAVGQCQ
jgi:hypothetical protein